MTKINVLVPCRAGSQRVPNKNTKPFAGLEHGLFEHKVRQLAAVDFEGSVIVSSDDEVVLRAAQKYKRTLDKRIEVVERPKQYAVADTLDAFINHISETFPPGIVAWTHVTSPLFGTQNYHSCFQAYIEKVVGSDQFDSLMTVKKIQNFMWRDGKCISHDRSMDKWPQTQDIKPFYEINSALFMIDLKSMIALNDRIGNSPLLIDCDDRTSLDVDWPDDFDLAEQLVMK